jgi:hypothetical protein
MLLGAPPFPIVTLVPLALGQNDPFAPHLTVLPVTLIPTAFAYSILHDQLWGIRRLVHRGLVYVLLSTGGFGIVILGVLASNRLFREDTGYSAGEIAGIAIIVVVGIMLYSPMRRGVRWIIDRAV